MEVPRDFQLLDDDDDIGLSQMSTSLYDSSTSKNANSSIQIQNRGPNSSITVNNNRNNNKISNSLTNLNNSDILVNRPRSSKFNISPNNPNANNAIKLELKSIERPRSHSPLKMKGIEEYIQLYANSKLILNNDKSNQINNNINHNSNKITMNLKMDDLLANVKNDSNSYQTLSDFSFMTGDSDLTSDGFGIKPRRRSLQNSNLKDYDWLNNKTNNLKELNKQKEDSLDNEANNDDDDVNDETSANDDLFNKGNNLNYKYTATYRKDETTGSFQEHSKIIFESKSKPKLPPLTAQKENLVMQNPDPSAKLQLANALEALYSNSKKLESKLDKIEDIRPSNNVYIDSSILTPDPDETKTPISVSNVISIFERSVAETNSQQQQQKTPLIKKKNDSFFNEFLTKSDDLIAQTQYKLEKLSKLETITKPLAPKPTVLALEDKLKPDITSNQTENIKAIASLTSETDIAEEEKCSSSLFPSVDLNNSKSLIDLKSVEQSSQKLTSSLVSNEHNDSKANTIDLLFDINENSYSLNTEPLKQRDSYFDLIGISRSDSSNLQEKQNTFQNQTNSILNYNINSRSNSPYRDDLLDSLLGTQSELTGSNQGSTSKISNEFLNSLYSNSNNVNKSSIPPINERIDEEMEPNKQINVINNITNYENFNMPNIDILITEPMNEKDDNNIVPEGLFNIKHEIPYDQSRPHSPLEYPISNENIKNSTISNEKLIKSFPSDSIAPVQTTQENVREIDLSFFNETIQVEPQSLPPLPPLSPIPSSTTIKSSSHSPSSSAKSAPPPPLPLANTTTTTIKSSSSNIKPKEKPKRPVFIHSPDMIRSRPKSRPPSPPPKQPPLSSLTKTSKKSSSNDIIDSIQQLNNLEDDMFNSKIKANVKKKMKKVDGQITSSSSSDDDDDMQKFQIKIRPKQSGARSTSNSNNPSDIEPETPEMNNRFVPLLPRPPKSAEEIEEFRKRRRSSGTESMTTRSLKENQSSDEDIFKVTQIEHPEGYKQRKESVQSEFNLELPDADDSKPLSDFNDKCELTLYPDGFYGCMVLVRQPFRNPNLMYKNALQKITEVRTWTECLVKLVDSSTNGKKLAFYNAHELMTLAAENETTLENIISSVTRNEKEEKDEIKKDDDVKKVLPFHEIELKASYKFTDMCLQQFDTYTKIHTFKMQDIIFKETIQIRPDRIMALPERFIKRFTKPKVTSLIDHTPLPIEICKFGHLNYFYLRSFLLLLQDAFWTLPTITRKLQREQQLQQIQSQPVTTAMSLTAAATSIFSFGSNKQITAPSLTSVTTHAREEVTVKVLDEYKCKLDKECRIIKHRSRTRVFLTTFLNSPDPKIEIGLNDCLRHGKEIVSRHEIVPIKTEQWISPEIFELNENVVNKEEFEQTHCLRCVQMPDNLLVEIMRFRTRPRRNYELPLQVRCYMTLVERCAEIRIECTVAGTYYTKLNEVHCEDIQIRFPLPDVWVYLFRVEKRFRYGAVHSSKHKFGKIKGLDRLLVHKGQSQGALMEASCGMAKYEQAFKSVVWRIEQLPVKNKDIYKTHLFICKFNLQEYDNLPDKYEPIAKIQYSIPICAASKSQVRSISVSPCEEPPEKWVKLKSKFEYDLDINYLFDQKELPLVDKENCAELQHLTVTESEGDNNEEDDNDD